MLTSLNICFALALLPGAICYSQIPLSATREELHKQEEIILRQKAEAGDPQAMYRLARRPYPIQIPEAEQLKWLEKAAQGGYGPAKFTLFHRRYLGSPIVPEKGPISITPTNTSLALREEAANIRENLIQCAKNGEAESIFILGASNSIFQKLGLTNFHDGVFWLRRALDTGDLRAPACLADQLFEYGESASEKAEGFERMRKLAEGGEIIAIKIMINVYSYGKPEIGLKADPKEALDWIARLSKLVGEDVSDDYEDPYVAAGLKGKRAEESNEKTNPSQDSLVRPNSKHHKKSPD